MAHRQRVFLLSTLLLSFFCTVGYAEPAAAETYKYIGDGSSFDTATQACVNVATRTGFNIRPASHSVSAVRDTVGYYYNCGFDIILNFADGTSETVPLKDYRVFRQGDACQKGSVLDVNAGECIVRCDQIDSSLNVSTGECGHDEQKGTPTPDSCVGNPINIAVGNKFQAETDYQSVRANGISFVRYYNSLDKIWRHNYSTFLRFTDQYVALVHADGREVFFPRLDTTAAASSGELGSLAKVGSNWVYKGADNNSVAFDANGRLLALLDANRRQQTLSYINGQVVVTSDSGETLTFTEDALHQPLSVTASGVRIDYSYNGSKNLIMLSRTQGSHKEQRRFFYEDARDKGLLTGITDERGVRFATWSYDEKGRAISSQHSGGAGLTRIAYNADGSSTVTNELGKSTVYRYQQIGGVKRVIAIEGEPSANCPASNSSYTYNDQGRMLTKTDANGNVTAYAYNERGLEMTRIEAKNTPQVRYTFTEWDPNRFLPTKVKDMTRVIEFTYDSQGREISRQITPR